ncbi:DUF7289 family protein [Haloarchaeobius sp. DFWS5]|uniref:DUF7289 family protein n=1 Tax=Haloarchaeobius sp. DFWS5 TaxID=3446114 RepID=UPI003EBA2913
MLSGPPTDDDETRAASELLGVVLLFGLVAIGAAAILLYGTVALDTLEERTTLSAAEMTMSQFDSRVSSAGSSPVGVSLGQRGNYRVVDDSSLTFAVNGHANCTGSIGVGSLRYSDGDGNRLAYEAGGIWKQTESGTVLVSPPTIRYDDGQLYFGVTNVSGGVSGSVDGVTAYESTSRGKQANGELRDELFGSDDCLPPENVTVTVESDFYEAWGRYFAEELNASTATVTDATNTATVTVPLRGSSLAVNESNNTVTANTTFTAHIEVLGHAFSTVQNHGNDDPGYYYDNYHLPVSFEVAVNGTSHTPWPDGDPDDALDLSPEAGGPGLADDVNDPSNGDYFTYDVRGRGGTRIAVTATSYFCGPYGVETDPPNENVEWTGLRNPVRGSTYNDYVCAWDQTADHELRNLSSTDDSDLIKLLVDGDELGVPSGRFTNAYSGQRNPATILGSDRLYTDADGDLHVDLESNQALYLYDLNEDESSGDFNDAIVLVTIVEQGVGSPENFALRVDQTAIVVEESDEDE